MNIEKKLFVERISADGQKSLQPLTEVAQLFVGDKIVSRLTARLDRAMDFVQLKDQRGACFEPENSLSGYRWNNGVGYYAEVEDAGTNFFFDHLGKGVMYWNIATGWLVVVRMNLDWLPCSVPMRRNMLLTLLEELLLLNRSDRFTCYRMFIGYKKAERKSVYLA